MKVIEKGHIYEFQGIDSKQGAAPYRITYVNREKDAEHPGIQSQDAIRSLIDRTKHCDKCLRWEGNDLIIHHLRMALVLHEARALIRKVEKSQLYPEYVQTASDGHFELETITTRDSDLPPHYTMAQVPDDEKPRAPRVVLTQEHISEPWVRGQND